MSLISLEWAHYENQAEQRDQEARRSAGPYPWRYVKSGELLGKLGTATYLRQQKPVTVGLLKKLVRHVSDGSHCVFLFDKCGYLSLLHTDSEVFQQPHSHLFSAHLIGG